ncbi:MAG: anthranilate phosphoribosyltransferase [Chloroflexota bacterium]|nr:anthranilate phosphoribosyltransferase [Chloroflexota bacterium]
MIVEATIKATEGASLTRDEAAQVMTEIMDAACTPAQFGAFVTALRVKGETADEIAGCAEVMREKALPVAVSQPVADTCGTGGTGVDTFNISTATAFVMAAAGQSVAKHGNRAMTRTSGSADVLEALGVKIDLGPEGVAHCIEEVGMGFMFAQRFHPAMKFAAPLRREIGICTIFNILGPLTNPARASYQVLGVANPNSAEDMARVLGMLGVQRAIVVHGELDGVDEISVCGPTLVSEWDGNDVRGYRLEPADFGLNAAPVNEVLGRSEEMNAQYVRDVLAGKPGPRRDVVVMNAAAGLVVSGRASDWKDGAAQAAAAIDNGQAAAKLEAFAGLSQSLD